MTILPSIVCLKSVYNNKYLRYRDGDETTHGLLQFSGDKVMDPSAQFEVVPATDSGNDGLVHLKSRFSNKFLVRWSPNHFWITASADKPNEDKTNWGCTLFKPSNIIEGNTQNIRLLHVQLEHYACLWRIGAPFDSCLFAGYKETDKDKCDIVNVVDWTSISKLPKHVAFKGDNGKYLGAVQMDGKNCLQFSFDDPNDSKVAQEIITSPAGFVYIKSKYYDKYWRQGDDYWIVADSGDEPSAGDASGMFRLNVLDVGVVALLNMSSCWYCKRYNDAHGNISFLSAFTQSADIYARLGVTDLGL